MGNPFEGSRRQDYAEKTPITPTILNRIQDDMIEAFEARTLNVTTLFAGDGSTPAWYHLITAGITSYWKSISAQGRMLAGLPLRVGEVITQVDYTVYGSSTGGFVSIYRRQLITGTGNGSFNDWASVQALGSDPFNTASQHNRVTQSSLSITIESGYQYAVMIEKTDDANECRIGDVLVTTQFGTGA